VIGRSKTMRFKVKCKDKELDWKVARLSDEQMDEQLTDGIDSDGH